MENARKNDIPVGVITVGKNIKKIIEDRKLKARLVAHDADLNVESLRRYMSGDIIMGIDKVIRIAKALDVEVAELFEGV